VLRVMASGGMVTTGTDVYTPTFPIEELRLLVEQAHAADLPVTAHAHAAAAVDQAVAVAVRASNMRHTQSDRPKVVRDNWPGGPIHVPPRSPVCPTLGGFNAAALIVGARP
jgi:hypothetical protein